MNRPSRMACLLLLSAAGSACAAPVTFTYTGHVKSASNVAGFTSVGDAVTVSVVLDNGGTSIFSQNWAVSDTLSAVFSAGSYTASFLSGFFLGPSGFTTDAQGQLTSAEWFGTEVASGTDNFGTGVYLSNVGVDAGNRSVYANRGFDMVSWSGPVMATLNVPAPSTAALVALALAGLGMGQRRKSRA
jgi:MYXO-CTERM domain-containing protein